MTVATDKPNILFFFTDQQRLTGYGPCHWTNLAVAPPMYDRLFEAVSSPAIGIEYDPSHFAWQGIDYVKVVRDYATRIYHCHAKDIIVDETALRRCGIHGSEWWRFCIPGVGQIDWPVLFDVLRDAGYKGDMTVEHEDCEFAGERANEGLELALKTLRPFCSD